MMKSLTAALLTWSMMAVPLLSQSDHAAVLAASGGWRLTSRIPLGIDTVMLRPAHRVIQMLASAESPEFSGWTLSAHDNQAVLLDRNGQPVQTLPRSLTFRVTADAQDSLIDQNPMPIDYAGSVNNFLLDMHFSLQIFRGMEMKTLKPKRAWLIGVPADEPSDERIYRATFDVGDLKPDDRVVLLITDGNSADALRTGRAGVHVVGALDRGYSLVGVLLVRGVAARLVVVQLRQVDEARRVTGHVVL